MTEEQALARIMEIIQADLPEAETREEVGRALDEYHTGLWQDWSAEQLLRELQE